ncbi:biotin transporter BioY [Homoserinimonas sp. A447]
MSAIALPLPSRSTIIDRVAPTSRVTTNVLLIVAGAAVTAGFAQIQVPLWPVPVTGQTLAVMLVGASLGARRGAAALALYIVAALAGLPVLAGFKGGLIAVTTPSFGFVIGFVFSAALIGLLSERRWDRRPSLALLGFLAASLVPFAFGLPYMAFILGGLGLPNDFATVIALGVVPFIIGGIVKWLIAAMTLPLLWNLINRLDSTRS